MSKSGGTIVPVGDTHALAKAIQDALRKPAILKRSENWEAFTLSHVTEFYMEVLGLER